MKTTSLQVRVPSLLRKEAEDILEDIGLDISTAIRVYLKKIVTSKGIPFPLNAQNTEPYSLLEKVEVDEEIQTKLDAIDSLWSQIKNK